MKRLMILLLILTLSPIYAIAAPKKMIPAATVEGKDYLPNIFIYTIPEQDKNTEDTQEEKTVTDNTAIGEVQEVSEDEAITLDDEENNIAIGATVLKGYAQYLEDTESIYLQDEDKNFVLNIKTPQKIAASKGLDFAKLSTVKSNQNYRNAEYFIAPEYVSTSSKIGNFTIGAQYNNSIDKYAMLETETGLFTRYEKQKFALSTSIAKSLDTTTATDYSNTFSLTPELKVNNYMTVKTTLSSNITYNKYSSQLTLSLNPFGKKDLDRLRFEIGAKETFSKETETTTSQILFSTKFKL